MFALGLLRGFVMLILLLVISLVVIFKFKNHLKSKSAVTGVQNNDLAQATQNKKAKKVKKENRVTKMVLSMSLNYIVGNFLNYLSPILFQLGLNSTLYAYYGLLANILVILSHFTYMIWYYKFNQLYKKTLLETFCASFQQKPVSNERARPINQNAQNLPKK